MGKVVYRLELPTRLSQIHNTFHVSQLQKCLADDPGVVPLDDIQVDEHLNYAGIPVVILDRKANALHKRWWVW